MFLASKDRPSHHSHIANEEWLLDLAFLVDITGMLNELNLDLQGKDKTIVDMISAVTAFKQKLKLVSSQLQQYALRNFRNMMSELENQVNNVISLTVVAMLNRYKTSPQILTGVFEI